MKSEILDPLEQNSDVDGIIYLDANDLPSVKVLADDVEFDASESHPIQITNSATGVIYERRLARWKDILTPPKTKAKCTKMCTAGPVKFCCRWKIYKKWLYNTATLKVTTASNVDIGKAIEECLKQAAVAAAVAAILSGGSAAIAAAEKVFTTCLSQKLGSALISVKIDIKSKWGNWSPI